MLIFRQLLCASRLCSNSLWVSSFWTLECIFLSKWGRRIKEDGLWLISPKWWATFYVCICVCVCEWTWVIPLRGREMVTQSVVAVSRSQEGSETLGFWADGGETEQRNFHSYWELNSYKLWGRGGGAAFCKLTCNLLVSIVALLSYWGQLDLSWKFGSHKFVFYVCGSINLI